MQHTDASQPSVPPPHDKDNAVWAVRVEAAAEAPPQSAEPELATTTAMTYLGVALDGVDPVLYALGLATQVAFVIDLRVNYSEDYAAPTWIAVALLGATWYMHFGLVLCHAEQCLAPATIAWLSDVPALLRALLALVLSPLLPLLVWVHWKVAGGFDATLALPVVAPPGMLPPPSELQDFDRDGGRADPIRRVVHGIAALTSAPRRLLFVELFNVPVRCGIQFGVIAFTSGSAVQYAAVAVTMLTAASKAYALCRRSTHVSTFAFKVAVVLFDLSALFYTLSVLVRNDAAAGEDYKMWTGTYVWFAAIGIPIVLSLCAIKALEHLDADSFAALLFWLVAFLVHLVQFFASFACPKLSWGLLTDLFEKPVHHALSVDEAVESRRLLVNFVTPGGVVDDARLMHLYRYAVNANIVAPMGNLNAMLEGDPSSTVSTMKPTLVHHGMTSWMSCSTAVISIVFGPALLVGTVYPFAHFGSHSGRHTTLDVVLFVCVIAALVAMLVLAPRVLYVSYVNCLMEPAFRTVLTTQVNDRVYTSVIKATWKLDQARDCVTTFFWTKSCESGSPVP